MDGGCKKVVVDQLAGVCAACGESVRAWRETEFGFRQPADCGTGGNLDGVNGKVEVVARRHGAWCEKGCLVCHNDTAWFDHMRGFSHSGASAWFLTENWKCDIKRGCMTWVDKLASASNIVDGSLPLELRALAGHVPRWDHGSPTTRCEQGTLGEVVMFGGHVGCINEPRKTRLWLSSPCALDVAGEITEGLM